MELLGIPFLYNEAGCRDMGLGPTHFRNVPFHCIVCGDLTEDGLKNMKKKRGIINGKNIITKRLIKSLQDSGWAKINL